MKKHLIKIACESKINQKLQTQKTRQPAIAAGK